MAEQPTQETPALEITDLSFTYPGASEPIVRINDLALAKGEQMLLAGGSGRGKSTLLQLIAGLIEPSQGHIHVDGIEISTLSAAKRDLYRGQKIGMIFQTFNLLSGFSALENVMAALKFGRHPKRKHRDRALELLTSLGIERVNAVPDQLSVGQQQRVAVARALACEPVLVLADEPTASLDPDNANAAMNLIQEACRARSAALLCTSHDPRTAARFERRASLDELARAGKES
ncbi:ABC transporter ATP-binding protein [Nodularia spumigena]|uniref:ABC transporter ATP-binding protein n=1 Tax=Nodularia spumigena TaxID=70799 RepID=UPI002B22086B|nr:ABC transporter ATP-binding protein [Nodularia spumigena]MEA5557579.1 ABC transporter ATP-binding protein [Nodularia spumigena CH309]